VPDEETVPAAAAGTRLDVFLAARAGSRAAAQRLIDRGHVSVDGEICAKRHLLAGGELVSISEPATVQEPTAPPASFAIAWEDEHLMVVDKPAGVVVHPARGHRQGTLVQALAGLAVGGERPGEADRRAPEAKFGNLYVGMMGNEGTEAHATPLRGGGAAGTRGEPSPGPRRQDRPYPPRYAFTTSG